MTGRESLSSVEFREDTPHELLAYAPAIFAMLKAVGWEIGDGAFWVEEALRDRYEHLAQEPKVDSQTSGRIKVSREWDGEEFVGLSISIDIATVYAENLPPEFPHGENWRV